MYRRLIMTIALMLLAASFVLAQDTGGDKARRSRSHALRRSRNSAEPPDPLVSHKSPGRSKRSKRRHHKPTPDALTVKQKTRTKNTQ